MALIAASLRWRSPGRCSRRRSRRRTRTRTSATRRTLARRGSLPGDPLGASFSTEQTLAGSASNSDQAAASAHRPRWTWDRARVRRVAARRTAELGERRAARTAAAATPPPSNPPLYYAFEARAPTSRPQLGPLRPAAGDADRLAAVARRHRRWAPGCSPARSSAATGCCSWPPPSVAGLSPMMTFVSGLGVAGLDALRDVDARALARRADPAPRPHRRRRRRRCSRSWAWPCS